jgi:hypothetical protein
MAYMTQELKKQKAPAIKKVLAKYGMKGTIGVRSNMTLVVNLWSGKLNIMGETKGCADRKYLSINPYYLSDNHQGDTYFFLKELIAVMDDGNYDNSDVQTDYFDVGFYIDINVGSWDKPYTVIGV